MTQFKKGDKVRYTGTYWKGNSLLVTGNIGATGIVSSTPRGNDDTVYVTWDVKSSASTPSMIVYQANVEKVETPKPKSVKGIHVGDKVRVTKADGISDKWLGVTGKVSEVGTESYWNGMVRVTPDSDRPDSHGKYPFWWKAENLELVEDEEEVEADAVAIFPPSDGEVFLTLDWNDAVILARALGMVNSGNLTQHSTSGNLQTFVDKMQEEIGRNSITEAKVYRASVNYSQVYLHKV